MPHDFVVLGVPLSLQAKNGNHKRRWKDRVAEAARHAVPEEDKYLGNIAIVIIHFSFD
jgi:hypothetical protein